MEGWVSVPKKEKVTIKNEKGDLSIGEGQKHEGNGVPKKNKNILKKRDLSIGEEQKHEGNGVPKKKLGVPQYKWIYLQGA